jgi:hypothetical protein
MILSALLAIWRCLEGADDHDGPLRSPYFPDFRFFFRPDSESLAVIADLLTFHNPTSSKDFLAVNVVRNLDLRRHPEASIADLIKFCIEALHMPPCLVAARIYEFGAYN